jgi:hypothetical protein
MSVRCPRCPGTLVVIAMTINQKARSMRSCSRCGYRGWVGGDPSTGPVRVELAGILSEIQSDRRNVAPRP